ncbi:MAG: hypothetical protein V1887_04525 [Candidatus Aenigmatarchaeota archaeon]
MLTEEQQDLIQKRYRIPCTGFVPDTYHIITLDRKSAMPTEQELGQLDSYREYTVRERYHEWLAEEILAKPLPVEAGHNTTVFAKGKEAWQSAGDGWAYRLVKWRGGPVYWPSMDTPGRHDCTLPEIIDYIETISENPMKEWLSWKEAHPKTFPPTRIFAFHASQRI